MPATIDYDNSFSRFTDPEGLSTMLDGLPDDVIGICEVAKQQTIHHNLLPYFNIPNIKWKHMNRVWPPKMTDILNTLALTEPHNLYDDRQPENRIIGACMLESHFLAGLLRHMHIPVRIRAGYFKNIRENTTHIVKFWENVQREKQADNELLKKDYEKWREELNAYSSWQNEIDHHIEHWICEYWDKHEKKWRLVDANNTFLKAHSDIDVGFHLPEAHFEYAFEAWKNMKRHDNFNPDQYAEEPQDGRSHIRAQLLWDFYSLLNHDLAGYDEPSQEAFAFIKEKKYAKISEAELNELDELANLLSKNPTKEALISFYDQSKRLKLALAKKDPYSFVFSK